MKSKVENTVEVVEVVLTNKELIAQAISKLSPEELAAIYPPIERANFVVRKSWLGRNQVITFVNNKNQRITYNHDEVLKVMFQMKYLHHQLRLLQHKYRRSDQQHARGSQPVS